ncbi:hypothetical protein H8D57_03965 [bacterium]|nr:hypothetical protein [bacterium]
MERCCYAFFIAVQGIGRAEKPGYEPVREIEIADHTSSSASEKAGFSLECGDVESLNANSRIGSYLHDFQHLIRVYTVNDWHQELAFSERFFQAFCCPPKGLCCN